MYDALVIGAGPAGVIIAAALSQQGLKVQGLAIAAPDVPWGNTYGIWRDELESLGLNHLLGHCWSDTVAYFSAGEVSLGRDYGLLDKTCVQRHFLDICHQHQVQWHRGKAAQIQHFAHHSNVMTEAGETFSAAIVIDVTGHRSTLLKRPVSGAVAYQAAYGVIGRFNQPPVRPGRFVLMDYRSEHLAGSERNEAPTFLYGMDLGEDIYFVEETCLASTPAVNFERLEKRLKQRLESNGVQVTAVHDIEHCLFPMTLPLPDFNQPVLGFGGAASMVHPATGYMVGALLRRAPKFAEAIALALKEPQASPQSIARAGWQTLWSPERLRKYYIYRFGLEKLMRFEESQLKHFFDTFFALPKPQWSGFLADTLSVSEVVQAMVKMFGQAPNDVRWGLMQFIGQEGDLLWRSLIAGGYF